MTVDWRSGDIIYWHRCTCINRKCLSIFSLLSATTRGAKGVFWRVEFALANEVILPQTAQQCFLSSIHKGARTRSFLTSASGCCEQTSEPDNVFDSSIGVTVRKLNIRCLRRSAPRYRSSDWHVPLFHAK